MMAATSATGSNPFTSALSGLSAALSHPPHPPNLSFDEMVEGGHHMHSLHLSQSVIEISKCIYRVTSKSVAQKGS